MIDPKKITNYNRTREELTEFLLFCVCVAGKNSLVQAQKLDEFLLCARNSFTAHVRRSPVSIKECLCWLNADGIEKWLRHVKMGQYNRIIKAFLSVALMDDHYSLEKLLEVRGIGPKTARFFLLHSFKGLKYAVLDTHILKFLKRHGCSCPDSTPQSKKHYRYLETRFIELWEKLGNGLTLAEFDLEIWKQYSRS